MSTFDGLIREFPTVAIDNFRVRPGVKVYLLSHVHSDHLAGLAALTWDSPIYCSPITARWLPMLATRSKQLAFESGKDGVLCRKYAHLIPFMRPLVTDESHYLDLGNGRRARISLIPAHHCPGAVMFLIQDDRSCILYTGDARNEAIDLQGLRAMPAFSSSMQQIDRLYLDTTCCHPAFEKFPSREYAISDLVTFINRRPRLAHYYIDAWTFGYEDIWIGLSKAFHTKIHVSPYLYELYEAIDDMISPKTLPHLTVDGSTARFHSCRLDKTCGYGGAGSEHAGSRMLIRIQPNVCWFSPWLRQGRQDVEEGIIAKGTVTGRSNTYTIKERLPPSIGKRDDLFYYFNYGCHASLSELQQLVELVSPRALFPCVLHRDAMTHTLFRSNREIVTLLAPYMPQRSGVSLDVEEYRDREPLMTDGVTTDFQDFQHAKAVYQVLDMNNETGGIATPNVGSSRPRTGQYTTTDVHRTSDGTPLSPRSRHLRKKMDKLKRQLRNTASLEEEEEEEGSSLEDGPLSVDLALVEKKRKRLLSCDRGQSSMTQETTEEEFSELHSRSGRYDSDVFRNGHRSDVSRTKEDSSRQLGGGSTSKPWYNQSTVILSRSVILNLDNDDDDDDDEGREEYGESDLGHEMSTDMSTDRSTDRSRLEPATPEGYVTSSPDSILSSLGLPEKSFDVNSFKSAEAGFDKNNPISLSSDLSAALSILSAAAAVVDPDITVADCLYSLPPSLPKTPPSRIPYHSKVIALGESPTKPGDGATPRYRSTSPSAARHSRRAQETTARIPRSSALDSMASLTSLRVEKPRGSNIFAQLAWSPPRKRKSRLTRAQTDPQDAGGPESHSWCNTPAATLVREIRRSRTGEMCAVSSDVIVIESSSSSDDS
ncbi:hypothetical protein BGX30_003998 [Mortierella sp. GBA39]|nr:hypothetical protein BGX30_003998 [Mortierella sp. GBA39]